jgi:hypothetical protein
MSFIQAFQHTFQAALLSIAARVSHFETEILHIPAPLRFFVVDAEPDQASRHAALFVIAAFNSFISMSLNYWIWAWYHSQPRSCRLRLCMGWYLLFLLSFWVSLIAVRSVTIF